MNATLRKMLFSIKTYFLFAFERINSSLHRYSERVEQKNIARKIGETAWTEMESIPIPIDIAQSLRDLNDRRTDLEKGLVNLRKEKTVILQNLKDIKRAKTDSADQTALKKKVQMDLEQCRENIQDAEAKLINTKRHLHDHYCKLGDHLLEHRPSSQSLMPIFDTWDAKRERSIQREENLARRKKDCESASLPWTVAGVGAAAFILAFLFALAAKQSSFSLPGIFSDGAERRLIQISEVFYSGDAKAYFEEFIFPSLSREEQKEIESNPENKKNAIAVTALLIEEEKSENKPSKMKVIKRRKGEGGAVHLLGVWFYDDVQKAGWVTLEKRRNRYVVVDGNGMGGTIPGTLKGNVFTASEPQPEPVSGIRLPAFNLKVIVEDLGQVEAVVKSGDTQFEIGGSRGYGRDSASFQNLPFGTHEIVVITEFTEPSRVEVKASEDDFPSEILVSLGKPLKIDSGAYYVGDFGRNQSSIMTWNGQNFESIYDPRGNILLGLHNDQRQFLFYSQRQILGVELSGRQRVLWDPLKGENASHLTYRPDFKTAAYLQHGDVFTRAIQDPNNTPERWTKIGSCNRILGWLSPDVLLVNRSVQYRHVAHLVFSDGTIKPLYMNNFYTIDKKGNDYIEYLIADDKLHYFDQAIKDMKEVKLSHNLRSSELVGRCLNDLPLLHIKGHHFNTNYAFVAIGKDRALLPYFKDRFAHSGSVLRSPDDSHLSFNEYPSGQDAVVTSVLRLSSMKETEVYRGPKHDRMFWGTKDSIVFVFFQGGREGTWLYPIDGGEPKKVFGYRADHVINTPDGSILMLANNTLWRVVFGQEPRLVGKEGTAGRRSLVNWWRPLPQESFDL